MKYLNIFGEKLILTFIFGKKLIKTFIFGERVKGEIPTEPKKFPERPLIYEDFEKWCKEYNVTMLHNRSIIDFK